MSRMQLKMFKNMKSHPCNSKQRLIDNGFMYVATGPCRCFPQNAPFEERLASALIIDDLLMKAVDDGFSSSTVNVLCRDLKMTDTGVTPLVVATIVVVSVVMSDNAIKAGDAK